MKKEAVHILCYPFSIKKLFNEACNKKQIDIFASEVKVPFVIEVKRNPPSILQGLIFFSFF